MFLQEAGNTDPKSLKEILNSFLSEFGQMSSAILNFETQAKKITADVFGQGTAFADSVRVSMANAASSTAELGVRVDDIADTYGAIAQQLRTNVMLSESQLNSFLEFQKATNVTAEQMGVLVEGFATLGVGPEKAAEQMSEMARTSRQYGLNTAQFMEKVGENLKLMNSYNFRDGVEGFTRMVARSQALRINMADVTGLAAKLLDPSEAINLAAQFQVLGGAVGALADPFQLMNMAQNDIEGLQNTILDAASAAVSFNETTGDFQIGATEMRRLRAQAEALGMDYEELANTAIKTAERNQKLDYLQFLDVTDEQREMLASIGQVQDGELKVLVKEEDEQGKLRDRFISAAEAMNSDTYKEQLEKMFNQSTMNDRQIAIAQMNALESIQKALEKPLIQIQAQVAGSDAFTDLRSAIKQTAESVGKFSEKMVGTDAGIFGDVLTNFYVDFSAGVSNLTEKLKEPDSYQGIIENVKLAGVHLGKYMYEGATDMWNMMKGNLTQEQLDSLGSFNLPSVGNTFSGFGGQNGNISGVSANNPLPVDLVKVTTTDPIKIDPLTMNFDPLTVNHGGTIQLQGVGSFDINQLTPTELQELSTKLKSYMDPSNILGT